MNRYEISRGLVAILVLAALVGSLPVRLANAGPTDPATLLSDPDNPHNLSNWATWSTAGIRADIYDNGGTSQVCIFCHTPHTASSDGPLWARPDPSGTFVLYGGNLAIKDQLGASGIKSVAKYYTTGEAGAPVGHIYPNGSSRLCMSCHDGVTAIGLLRDGTSIAMTGSLDGDGSLSGSLASVINLSTSHPISFVYTDAIAAQIDSAYDNYLGIPGNYFQGPTSFNSSVKSPLDKQSRMQCTTCHDPHYDNSQSNSLLPPFWQNLHAGLPANDAYDNICAQCHIGGNPLGPSGDHTGPGI